ncbi:MauE/DoxX family redox-associated membrane protein [Bacillus cereus]|uniref:MauE/DoxX family redox-associated membrane protein n=1 Tax=Bacillus cereus TaxID=1396 RepID=UPI00311AB93F
MSQINILSSCIDLSLAFIFFASFYMKSYSIHGLKCDLILYNILPLKSILFFSYMVLILEFCIFIMFVLNIYYPYKELGTIALMIGFILLILRKKYLYKLEKTSCSCFGKMQFMNRSPIVRNSIIVILLIIKVLLPFSFRILEISLFLGLLIVYTVLLYNLISLKNNDRERLNYGYKSDVSN